MNPGSCLCGTVRYEIEGPFSMMINCHCSMCRKHHGAAFATFVTAPLAGFRWVAGREKTRAYASSPVGERSFCGTCGSVTPMLAQAMQLAVLPAGNLQGELDIRPQSHMFVGSKAPWYTLTDALPQHEEFPPEFEGATAAERPEIRPREGIMVGSCLCGEVAYELTGSPARMVNCYCSRCRRGRSAAHATNLFYPLENFRFVRGAGRVVDYQLPEAQYFGAAFCDRCGAKVPRQSPARGVVVVPGGSLDVDPGARPTLHIHVASKASWVDITDTMPQFAETPPAH